MKTPSASKGKKEVRGCIDLGSSYFRLLVVEGEFGDGVVQTSSVCEERIFVGWGREFVGKSMISPQGIDSATRALTRMIELSRSLACNDPVIVATNTLRSSANRGDILKTVEESTGRKVKVLSERGEAALGFIGASSLLTHEDGLILSDPGGTSTEITWGRRGKIEGYASIPWGTHTVESLKRRTAVKMAAPARRSSFLIITESIREAFDGALLHIGYSSLPDGDKNPRIAFTGGTAVSLSIVLRFLRRQTPRVVESCLINADELGLVGRRIRMLIDSGRGRMLPLAEERIKLLLPGLILVEAIAGLLEMDSSYIVTRDLRWGVVLEGGKLPWGYLADEQEGIDSR